MPRRGLLATRVKAPDDQVSAIEALGEIAAGDEEVLAALESLTTDEDEGVAVAAAATMAKWPSLPERVGAAFVALAARVEADIERKQGHRSAADAFFRRRP